MYENPPADSPSRGGRSLLPKYFFMGVLALFLSGTVFQCAYAAEAVSQPRSLLNTPLRNPEWSDQTRAYLEKDIQIARQVLKIAPEREDSYIWLGRRLTYMNRFAEAITVYTEGLNRFPGSYKLLRFRGRSLARTRQFKAAIADYTKGLALMEGVQDSYEPDGLVNARNQSLGSYRSNFLYYRAQTSWAVGDYASTLKGMQLSGQQELVQNTDHQVAVKYWSYLALRKLGRHEEARQLVADVPDHLELLENDDYHRGVRVMKGTLRQADFASMTDTLGLFAVAMESSFRGDRAQAESLLEAIILAAPQGFWPAETELIKMRQGLSVERAGLTGAK